MTVRGVPAPLRYLPSAYWEDRAQRFAGERGGLAAICAYGMPEFYNRAIDREQRLALRAWLDIRPATRILDAGCGVGRWSRLLAARGALVTGIDLSPTMIEEARQRARAEGVAQRCRFEVRDLTSLDLGEAYDLVLGVTVLQHIVDRDAFRRALRALAAHLAPGGRLVLLEAAPAGHTQRCNSTVFTARRRAEYIAQITECGLTVRTLTGVDPAPFRRHLIPHLRNMPAGMGLGLLSAATLLSYAINIPFGRRAVKRSWHTVFVADKTRAGENGAD